MLLTAENANNDPILSVFPLQKTPSTGFCIYWLLGSKYEKLELNDKNLPLTIHRAFCKTVCHQSFQGSSSMYSFSDRIDVPLWSLCCKTFTSSAASSKLVITGTLNSTAFRRISYPSVNASE